MKIWHIERPLGLGEPGSYYVPLKPTGKWKLETNMVTQEMELFIQHRTWCGIPWWIREYDIVPRTPKRVHVHRC